MPNRRDMPYAPDGRWERALWFEENLDEALRNLPMHAGWSGISSIEAKLFPAPPPFFDMDPSCPQCGVETAEGRGERESDGSYVLTYTTCGHVVMLSPEELAARARKS